MFKNTSCLVNKMAYSRRITAALKEAQQARDGYRSAVAEKTTQKQRQEIIEKEKTEAYELDVKRLNILLEHALDPKHIEIFKAAPSWEREGRVQLGKCSIYLGMIGQCCEGWSSKAEPTWDDREYGIEQQERGPGFYTKDKGYFGPNPTKSSSPMVTHHTISDFVSKLVNPKERDMGLTHKQVESDLETALKRAAKEFKQAAE